MQRNGIKQSAPYSSADYKIFKRGRFIVVQNQCGMMAWFDGKHTAKVHIYKEDGLNATGLCGNCNGEKDDFVTKDGTDVSGEDNKFSLIGISHRVEGPDDIEAV